MNTDPKPGEATTTPVVRVLLELLANIYRRYEEGARQLVEELDLPTITSELLMQVCLAAAHVEDLVMGFIREDLCVVSLGEQTRRMVERDVGRVKREKSGWGPGPLHGLRGQMNAKDRAEAEARMAQGSSSELEAFIRQNPEVYSTVNALTHDELVRWVMLYLMRETEGRKQASVVIAQWREQLGPDLRKRVAELRELYRMGNSAGISPSGVKRSPAPRPGPKMGPG